MIKQILLWLGSAALTALLLIGFGAMTGCYVAPIQHEVLHKKPVRPAPRVIRTVCPDYDDMEYCHWTEFKRCRHNGWSVKRCERKLLQCVRRVCGQHE